VLTAVTIFFAVFTAVSIKRSIVGERS
jgi:hypothetical protein